MSRSWGQGTPHTIQQSSTKTKVTFEAQTPKIRFLPRRSKQVWHSQNGTKPRLGGSSLCPSPGRLDNWASTQNPPPKWQKVLGTGCHHDIRDWLQRWQDAPQ
jgi:hypothetical protein